MRRYVTFLQRRLTQECEHTARGDNCEETGSTCYTFQTVHREPGLTYSETELSKLSNEPIKSN